MDIRPIRNEEDHRAALAAIEACWGAPEGTEEGDKLDVLLALVDIYEARRWPVGADELFDPIDVLRYAIAQVNRLSSAVGSLDQDILGIRASQIIGLSIESRNR